MERYKKNMSMLSPEENLMLKNFKVCVVGCGGLGGYIIEMLARLGIGKMTIVDGDIFSESNLNRQLYSDENSIGVSKVQMAVNRLKSINSLIEVKAFNKFLQEDNAESILQGHDVIVDGLDNIASRMLLQEYGEKLKIPFVHGAIAGWYGQITTIFPGDKILDIIYPEREGNGVEDILGNPSFTPALVASIQVSEVLKVLISRGEPLRNKILYINLLNNDYNIIDINNK